MSDVFAIVPVKRFGAAKRRLARRLGPAPRARLAAAMAADALEAIARAELIDALLVVSGEPRSAELASAVNAELVDDPRDEGHSEAALRGLAVARERGAGCALLLPGDCPLLDPAELDVAIAAAPEASVGVAVDRHGSGTNGLILRPPDAIVPAFGPGSRERHLELAAEAGLRGYEAAIPSLELDLDTGEDLLELRTALAHSSAGARRTREALAAIPAASRGGA